MRTKLVKKNETEECVVPFGFGFEYLTFLLIWVMTNLDEVVNFMVQCVFAYALGSEKYAN
jgi:hypothetical protein